MKGVILAGGSGTRLKPLTVVTNKHLVPVGNIPMIEYPLSTLTNLGIENVSIVTGGEHFQDIASYLGETHPNINFAYHVQKEAGGIAQALKLAQPSASGDNVAVILGDNVYERNFADSAKEFNESGLGAMFFLKKVANPKRFGVAEIDNDRIVSIEEKPKNPKTNYAVTGLYFYAESLWDNLEGLTPSARGEYEITDVNNKYVETNKAGYHIFWGFWSDAGTHSSRKICNEFVKEGLEKRIIYSFSEKIKSSLPSELF